MFTQAEMIVLMWFLPVVLNIILPLTVGAVHLIGKLLRNRSMKTQTVEADQQMQIGQQLLSATRD